MEIEQEELAARIRGCNLTLRAMEVELQEKGAWTAARLEPLARRLQVVALRRHDLELFRGLLPPQQRSGMETLASTKSAVSSLAAHIVEARNRAFCQRVPRQRGGASARAGASQRLSRRLAMVAGK